MATIQLNKELFLNDIFDYEKSRDWKYKDSLPAIIDFYADWCGPCKMVAPVLEQISNEYGGRVKVYKIDTEAEQELAAVFGIRSIPSLLFIPVEGQPQMLAGALPKNAIEKIMGDVFFNEAETTKEA